MSVPRTLAWLAIGSSLLPLAGLSQTAPPQEDSAGYRGLHLGRPAFQVHCGTIAFPCDEVATSVYFYGRRTVHLGLELGYLTVGRADVPGIGTQASGLNVSLISRKTIGEALGVHGRLGTVYARTNTAPTGDMLGASGFGLSYGAGVSWELTPQATATLNWDSHDFRLAPGGGDMVRSTSLGLQWRY